MPAVPDASELAGTYVAMITPFGRDGELDVPGLRANVDWWIDEGVHGLIPAGSTGEFLQLEDREWEELVEVTVDAAAGRVPVVAGCTSDSTAQVIRRVSRAEAAGASAAMVAPPFYSLPTEREVVAHFQAIGDGTSLPIMAYNNPATTGIDLVPRVLARLAETPAIRYVKESTVDVRRVEEILLRTDGRMRVFAGILGYESFLIGATGWVSVPANVAPRLCADLYNLAVIGGDVAGAAEVNRALWDLMAIEDETGKYVQIPKEALAMMGRPAGLPRGPRLQLTEEERARLRQILAALSLVPLGP
jgi:4-hydroxy-tetrahydrodipicolinate synthase